MALARGEKSDGAEVKARLDVFLRDRAEIAAQVGKDVCHTGKDGQASYYFFYDHAFAAEAARALDPEDRARFGDAVRAAVLEVRQQDGGFVDMPSLGRPYATAMALEVLAP